MLSGLKDFKPMDGFPLDLLHTHSLPIDRLEHAIRLLAGEMPGEQAPHISILADA